VFTVPPSSKLVIFYLGTDLAGSSLCLSLDVLVAIWWSWLRCKDFIFFLVLGIILNLDKNQLQAGGFYVQAWTSMQGDLQVWSDLQEISRLIKYGSNYSTQVSDHECAAYCSTSNCLYCSFILEAWTSFGQQICYVPIPSSCQFFGPSSFYQKTSFQKNHTTTVHKIIQIFLLYKQLHMTGITIR
jgi:hypothetical protein